jgi:drug/metabolite transporter (DMT)-like permease
VNRQLLALLAIVATVVMWGASSVAIKAVSTTGLVTALYRLWFSIPPLWLTMLPRTMRRRVGREWLRGSVIGGLLFSVHQVLWFMSIKLTTVADVTIIGALQPVLVLLVAGPLFGERASSGAIAWSAVAFVGTIIVVLGATHAPTWSLLGDVLALANLFAFTAYFLGSKRIRETVGAWEYVVGMTTVAGVVMLLVTLATHQDFGNPTAWEWCILVGIAIFPGTLGHVLVNWAHEHVPAFVSSMILLAVPIIATAGAAVVLDEAVSALQIGGGAIVLVAIAIIVATSRRRDADVLAESAALGEVP